MNNTYYMILVILNRAPQAPVPRPKREAEVGRAAKAILSTSRQNVKAILGILENGLFS